MPFHRMKVRLKREIVTMGEPDIDPLADAGTYVAPADWNALIDAPGTLADRHAQRLRGEGRQLRRRGRSGHARASAISPPGSRHTATRSPPRRASRCSAPAASAARRRPPCSRPRAIEDVHHLEGGILKYLEEVPAAESRWQGECFVFDERVAVGHGLEPGTPHAVPRLPHAGQPRGPRLAAISRKASPAPPATARAMRRRARDMPNATARCCSPRRAARRMSAQCAGARS